MSELQPGELLGLCESLARRGGALAAEFRREGIAVAATKSSATDVVTQADRAVEDLLRSELALRRPDDAVMGEEGDDVAGTSGLTWVIDPIDGTVNYLYGIGQYAVSVAIVTGDPRVPGAWNPIAGCVYNPTLDRAWTAAQGQGAWVSGRLDAAAEPQRRQLLMGEPPPLELALVGTGFAYLPERRRRQGELVAQLLPRVRDIRRMGSSALDLCAVADGSLDAYYEEGLNPWDVAAGFLVVTEAGGRLAGPQGGPPDTVLTAAGRDPLLGNLVACIEGI